MYLPKPFKAVTDWLLCADPVIAFGIPHFFICLFDTYITPLYFISRIRWHFLIGFSHLPGVSVHEGDKHTLHMQRSKVTVRRLSSMQQTTKHSREPCCPLSAEVPSSK